MALFEKNKILEFLSDDVINEEDVIKIPKEVNLNPEKKSLFAISLDTILELGDESDYEKIVKAISKNFFISNEDLLFSKEILKIDDISIITQILNYILSIHNLGIVQFFINEKSKDIKIYHYNNFFKKIYPEKKDYFFLTFYELFFEKLLEKKVKIEEKGSDNEKVIFKITN